MTTKSKIIVSLLLISLGAACRLLPHAWNFAPIAAVALFAGVYLGRGYAVAVPVIAMAVSDIFIGFYELPLLLAVYGSYIIIGLLGSLISQHKSFETVLASTITGAVLFFGLTNWAVWQFSPWYEKSLAGLIQCYTLALPFFRNTFAGDLFYVAVFFGSYQTVLFLASQKKLSFN